MGVSGRQMVCRGLRARSLASRALGTGHQGGGTKWRPWRSYQEAPVEADNGDVPCDGHGRLVQDRIPQEDAMERARGLFEVKGLLQAQLKY